MNLNDGDVTIQNLHRQSSSVLKNSVVYVKGLDKAKYVKEFFTSEFVKLGVLSTP